MKPLLRRALACAYFLSLTLFDSSVEEIHESAKRIVSLEAAGNVPDARLAFDAAVTVLGFCFIFYAAVQVHRPSKQSRSPGELVDLVTFFLALAWTEAGVSGLYRAAVEAWFPGVRTPVESLLLHIIALSGQVLLVVVLFRFTEEKVLEATANAVARSLPTHGGSQQS